MTLEELREKHRDDILRITGEYGITNVRVFGSVARGEADESSDIDLLVTLPKRIGWKLFGCEKKLEEALSTSVDIVGDRGLSPHFGPRIINDARPL